jgi:GntR family transcriptional regulator
MSQLIQRSATLADQVLEVLRQRIETGQYEPGAKIPPETELAAEFDVSRATVRSALSTLETQGRVVRRQGAGTFVSQLPHISNPLDRAIDFQELIARCGLEPSVQFVYTALTQPSASIAAGLDLTPDTAVLESHKIFYADDRPVIYCVNSLPVTHLEPELLETILEKPETVEPIYEFFEERVGRRVALHLSSIRATRADETAFHGGLPLEPSDPVLVLDSVAYTGDTQPLFHTYEYHHHPDEIMSLELVRHRW